MTTNWWRDSDEIERRLSAIDRDALVKAADELVLAGAAAVCPMLEVLLRPADDGSHQVIYEIVEALGNIAAPGISRWLRATVGDRRALKPRAALMSIVARSSPDLLGGLILSRRLAEDLRRDAATWLAIVTTVRRRRVLARAVHSTTWSKGAVIERRVRVHGLELLAGMTEPLGSRTFKLVMRFAVDRDPEVRARALAALRFAGPRGGPLLVQALIDPNNNVRGHARWALDFLGEDGQQALLKGAGHPDPRIRKACRWFFGWLRCGSPLDRLALAASSP